MKEDNIRCHTLCELQNKQVININDGKMIGYISDAEIDICCGEILCFLLPCKSGFLHFSKREPERLYWNEIVQIGEDAILIRSERFCGY